VPRQNLRIGGVVFAFVAVAFQAATACDAAVSALDPNGPDESQQFAAQGGDDFALDFTGCGQPGISLEKPYLRSPSDLPYRFRNTFQPITQARTDSWPVSITPGGFNGNASEVRVLRPGNRTAAYTLAAGLFAGHCAAPTPRTKDLSVGTPAVAHQLTRTCEARHLPKFGHDGDRRNQRDATQRLQALDNRWQGGEASLTASAIVSAWTSMPKIVRFSL
jgi:hypothetical protein